MLKGGRKGRISNELVAASCAAILAVHAAGTWRTRDAAKGFGAGGEMRRPVPPVAAAPGPAVVEVTTVKPAPAAEPSAPEPAHEAAADQAEPPAIIVRRWHDGYYTGWGQSRHGDIQAFVRMDRVTRATESADAYYYGLVMALQNGAFDPTVGSRMAARGCNRNYLTGATTDAPGSDGASFRDVVVDADHHTILLRRPLTLDLGAVAKGLAVDAAAHELQPFRDFCIDAGGDLYFGGYNPAGRPWRVGIRHPRRREQVVDRQPREQAAAGAHVPRRVLLVFLREISPLRGGR